MAILTKGKSPSGGGGGDLKKIKIIRFDLNLIKVDSNNNRLMLGKGESRRLLRRRGEET